MRAAVRGLGELLVTAGVILLLFVAYELWGTGAATHREQGRALDELQRHWDHDIAAPPSTAPSPGPSGRPASPPPGGVAPVVAPARGVAYLVLHIPRFGRGWEWAVVEGVGRSDLAKGPGHYPGTAEPGEIGNVAVAGHRTTHGAPFNRLDELERGDAIVVESARAWFTYRVTGREIVSPRRVDVVAPVPGRPGATPTQRLLTLTTCNPKYSARQRLVVHARLASTTPRGGALPDALRAA